MREAGENERDGGTVGTEADGGFAGADGAEADGGFAAEAMREVQAEQNGQMRGVEKLRILSKMGGGGLENGMFYAA